MPSYEELAAANAAIRELLASGVAERLRAIPGVRHVSAGLKVSEGRPTRELCIRVYVREKIPDARLPVAERIPREIDGVRTDVNVVRRIEPAVDATRYRPVKGGIMISNLIIGLNESGTNSTMEAGTFGCTATLTRDGSPVLLSNWHVLMANGARIGEPIFQPAPLRIPDVPLSRLPVRRVDEDDVIAHITDARITTRVDAAIARLDVSSCCRCCGLDFEDQVAGLSVGGQPPSNNILGMRAAQPGQTVYKVGIRTGRTVGSVIDDDVGDLEGHFEGQDYSFEGQIEIASDDPDEPFSLRGDSGAAIIDDEGYIVGLLFASVSALPPDHRTYANHIAEVCSALGITINLTMGALPNAGPRVAVPRATVVTVRGGRELYERTRARVREDPAGAWLWALAEAHREEIVSLITTRRPVTVTWHRAGGPALFAMALETLRADGDTLPVPRDGGTLEAALARVGTALGAHGSPALREALAAHREVLLDAVRDSVTVGDALAKLRASLLLEA